MNQTYDTVFAGMINVQNRIHRRKQIRQFLFEELMIQRFLCPFLALPDRKKWVFIVGCYNSGTTLLNHILGQHDEIAILPGEGASLTRQFLRPEQIGWPRMWHKCLDKLCEYNEWVSPLDSIRLKKEWGFFFDSRKPVFLEKSIINSIRIDWFQRHFDEPYFIWIIRNGYAAAEGIRRRVLQNRRYPAYGYPDGYPADLCIRQWIAGNEIIEKSINPKIKILKVTYEDLTDRPDDTVKKIIGWLPVGKKVSPRIHSFDFHGQLRPIKNLNAESIRNLTDDDIRVINQVGGSHLIHWGYGLIDA